jgi:hypothetical protein
MVVFNGVRKSVQFAWLDSNIVQVLNHLAVWSARQGLDIHITSMNDHTHSKGSLHYRDLALDFQVGKGQLVTTASHKLAMKGVVDYLRSVLGMGFDILYGDANHKTHCHVEFDVKQRRGAWTTEA